MEKIIKLVRVAIVSMVLLSCISVFAETSLCQLEEDYKRLDSDVEEIKAWMNENNIEMIVESYNSAKNAFDSEVNKLNQAINLKITWITVLITLWTLFGIVIPIYDRNKLGKFKNEIDGYKYKLRDLEKELDAVKKLTDINRFEQNIENDILARDLTKTNSTEFKANNALIIGEIKECFKLGLIDEKSPYWNKILAGLYYDVRDYDNYDMCINNAIENEEDDYGKYMLLAKKGYDYQCRNADDEKDPELLKRGIVSYKEALDIFPENEDKLAIIFNIMELYIGIFAQDEYLKNKFTDYKEYLDYLSEEVDILKETGRAKDYIIEEYSRVENTFKKAFIEDYTDTDFKEQNEELWNEIGPDKFIETKNAELRDLIR